MIYLNFGRTSQIRTGDLYHVNIDARTTVHSSPPRLTPKYPDGSVSKCKTLPAGRCQLNTPSIFMLIIYRKLVARCSSNIAR
jgi:hypothetical protein